MGKGGGLLVVVTALAFAAALFGPFAGAIDTNTDTHHVENETLTAEVGTWQDLDEHSLVGGSETVFGLNETSSEFEEAESGTDYEINYSHGRIKPLNSSTLIDDGEEYKVSYDWQRARGITAQMLNILPLVVALLMVVMVGNHIGRQS